MIGSCLAVRELLLFLLSLITTVLLSLCSLGLLSPHTAWTTATEWRGEREVDVLLGVETDDEGWDVDDLLADAARSITLASVFWESDDDVYAPNVTLTDEDTRMMDGLGETELVDAGLQATLQEVFGLEGEHVIELHAGFVEHTDTDQTANEGIAFEQTLWVLLFEGEKLTVQLSVHVLSYQWRLRV
jgi:hypothetical protein